MGTSVYEVTVGWGDCDPARIVFYPNYFRWFDDAARHLFAAAGMPWETLFDTYGVVGLPLVDAQARFLSPARLGDRLRIETRVKEWRRKALVLSHRVVNGGRVVAEGTETRVWATRHPDDPERLKTGTIPEELKTRLAAAEY
ncbi:MAG: acyl-CoA thioesterase [Alphaproteobacteria bacterium]